MIYPHKEGQEGPSVSNINVEAHKYIELGMMDNGKFSAKQAKCKICNKTSASVNSLDAIKKHVLSEHFKLRFGCDICSMTFKWSTHLSTHRKQHFSPAPEAEKK